MSEQFLDPLRYLLDYLVLNSTISKFYKGLNKNIFIGTSYPDSNMLLKKTCKIWIDGKICKFEDAKIHILTHALHYGTACFEGIHSYKTEKGTAIFRLKEHLDRFFESAKVLGMKLDFSSKDISNAIKKLIKINKLGDAYIRPLAFYGYGSLDVYPKDVKPSIALITLPCYSKEKKPLKLKTSSLKKINPSAFIYGAKLSGFYANSVMAMHEARVNGYDEALMLDDNGKVSEGPCQNIFMIKHNNVITSNSRSILPGVTRDSLLKLSRDMGFHAEEKEISLEELKNADEAFYCGTLSEIIPIGKIDNSAIGNGETGKITKKLKEEFSKIARGKNAKYKKWLEYV